MKLDSLNNIDLNAKVLVIGDCATNHIENFTGLDNIISRQIQGGLGAEKEIADINKPSAVMLFVSWANALSVITDEDIYDQRLSSHLTNIKSLVALDVPFLMIDRHGFLDRFADAEFLDGRGEVPYPQALREGWRPQNPFEQVKRRLKYRQKISKYVNYNCNYFDLADYLGTSTYRHESGECKNNLVNIAPWHYDPDSYRYSASVLVSFLAKKNVLPLIQSWELGVLNLKTESIK